MSPRDLLLNPCWHADDLGQALPDSPHAVSVALPRWQDVIAYEEKDPDCLKALRAIYPRFGLNPLVAEVAQQALAEHGSAEGSAWPYPTTAAAERAQVHCHRIEPMAYTAIEKVHGLPCLITDAKAASAAKAFWQHSGLGASSRQAASALEREPAPLQQNSANAQASLRKRLAEIYSCDDELVQLHPSGMAALTKALEAITLLRPGRPFLQLGFPYVDVLKLPQEVFGGSDLLLTTESKLLAVEFDRRQPAAVIVELPSNPMLQCVDLPAVAKLAHSRGIPVIADDTIGSPLNIDVLPYADLVFSSLTKSFAGRGDILAGSLVVSPHSRWREHFCKQLSTALAPLADADAIALEEASRDVAQRVPQLNNACEALANQLSKHPAVIRVLHPGKCANFQSLMRPGAGHGCLLSFELVGGLTQAKRVYDALQVCKGPSLGTSFTLVCPYVLLAHYNELSWAESCGVPSHLLRVSVGLEDPDALWRRFEMALTD